MRWHVDNSRRARILVVDDDRATRIALRELLSLRYEVDLAADAEEALAAAHELVPDVLLVDVFLPGRDGLTLCEELSRDARTEQVPIVFTSSPSSDLAVRCLDIGGADFVPKPVAPAELVARIDRAIREGRALRALQELAQTDALTGLPNYRGLARRVGHEFHRANRYGHPLCVVTLDLDHLKHLNDRYGHEAGNRALVALARHLRANLREADFAARFGGDEFVVLLPHQTPAEASILVARLMAGLRTLRVPVGDGEGVSLTISVGIAGHFAASPKRSSEELMQASDAALNEAKRRGRNRVVVYEAELERGTGASEPGGAWTPH